jgi:hypothetical protein
MRDAFVESHPCAKDAQGWGTRLLGEVDVFQIVQMVEDGLAGVVSLGASGALGEAVEAFFDGFGKADG